MRSPGWINEAYISLSLLIAAISITSAAVSLFYRVGAISPRVALIVNLSSLIIFATWVLVSVVVWVCQHKRN